MKQVVMFILLCSSIVFSQGIYFSEPTSSHIDYIYASGEGPIVWNFYHANDIVVYRYYAKLTYPDGSQTEWTTSDNGVGKIGGWWVSEAGTYQIQGKAWVKSIFGGSEYWAFRKPFSFNVVDNYAP